MNEAFAKVMKNGCIVDVSSMSAYLTPSFIMPRKIYLLSSMDKFMKKIMKRIHIFPKKGANRRILCHFQEFCNLARRGGCPAIW